ncbi:MAG: YHS domain-containing protein [Luteitalea sp.]|nr:YHS domain-containing protein [Luteitalea sp.]
MIVTWFLGRAASAGKTDHFCSETCKKRFTADPQTYSNHK